MKKIVSFLVLCIVLVSCSSSDDGATATNEEITAGNWKVTAIEIPNGTVAATVLQASLSVPFTATGKEYDITWDLAADNTFTSEGQYTGIFTFAIPNTPSSTREQVIDNFTGSGTWNVTGDTITLTVEEDGNTQTGKITSQTATSMTIELEINGTELQLLGGTQEVNSLIDFGTVTDITGTAVITLER